MAFIAVLGAPASSSARATVGSSLANAPMPDGTLGCQWPGCEAYQESLNGRDVHSPFSGVIVRWRLKVGPQTDAQQITLDVLSHPSPGTLRIRAQSSPRAVEQGAGEYSFADRVRVGAGDRIAVRTEGNGANLHVFARTSRTSDVVRSIEGMTADADYPMDQFAGSSPQIELLLNADIERDVDQDGFGDETQDADDDGDGVRDTRDNCPVRPNPTQVDTDTDGQGDACDPDDDADAVADAHDNCDTVANAEQTDTDADGRGDACDADDDGDTVGDGSDNCALAANREQVDTDSDGTGDACDADDDDDGDHDADDNCPLAPNPAQGDGDADRVGDACDPDDDNDGTEDGGDAFPTDPSEQLDTDGDGRGDHGDPDDDGDGVADTLDNCSLLAHASQLDSDGDGQGDACDSDDDDDTVDDRVDNCPLTANPDQANADGDGSGDVCDATPVGDPAGPDPATPDPAGSAPSPAGPAAPPTEDTSSPVATQPPSVGPPAALKRPANVRRPSVKGRLVAGTGVYCHRGAWRGIPLTLSYSWKLDSRRVRGATAAVLRLPRSAAGRRVACTVVATNGLGRDSRASRPRRVEPARGASGAA